MKGYKLAHPVYKLKRDEIEFLLKKADDYFEINDDYIAAFHFALNQIYPEVKERLPYRMTNPIQIIGHITYTETKPYLFHDDMYYLDMRDDITEQFEMMDVPLYWEDEYFEGERYYKNLIKGKHGRKKRKA